jgi:hypothetical protein
MGLKLREIWTDPTFLAAIEKMRAAEAVADQANGLGAVMPKIQAASAVADQADGPLFHMATTTAAPQGPKAGRQAELTKRLAALIGPYKEAASRNGPAAGQMQLHMAAAKKHIIERNFEQAAKEFDELEPLIVQFKVPLLNGIMADGGMPLPSTTGVQPQTPFPQTPAMSAAPDKRISTPTKAELENSPELIALLPDAQHRKEFMDWLRDGHGEGIFDVRPVDEQGRPLDEHGRPVEENGSPEGRGQDGHDHPDPRKRRLIRQKVQEWQGEQGGTPEEGKWKGKNKTRGRRRRKGDGDSGAGGGDDESGGDWNEAHGDKPTKGTGDPKPLETSAPKTPTGGSTETVGSAGKQPATAPPTTTKMASSTGSSSPHESPPSGVHAPAGSGQPTGGSAGTGGGGAGTPTGGGQPDEPPPIDRGPDGPAPGNTTEQQAVQDSINNYDIEAKRYDDAIAEVKTQRQANYDEFANKRTEAMNGKLGTAVFAQDEAKYEATLRELQAEERRLAAVREQLLQRGNELSQELAKVGEAELQSAFRTAKPSEVLAIARRGQRGSVTLGGMAGAAITLATAYFLVQSLLQANPEQRLDVLVDAGKNLAVGGAEAALVQAATKAGPLTAMAAVTFFNLLCDGSTCTDEERNKEAEQREKQLKLLRNKRDLAIGEFLQKHYPGSVIIHEFFEPHDFKVEVKDQKRWDEAMAQANEINKANAGEQGVKLGVRDGITGTQSNKNALEQAIFIDDDAQRAALEGYDAGYQEGEAKVRTALQRARELGMKDGKSGKPVHIDEIRAWPEVQSAGLSEVEAGARMTLLNKLLEVYNAGLTAAAPAGVVPRAPSGTITAGEAVERDKKAAALKRAHQLGTKDGQAGKPLHLAEIQTWPEVQTAGLTGAEAAARMTFLRELQEAYNAAFAAVAPAPSAPATPAPSASSALTAGEAVKRDKKAAVLERARALGMQDAKAGKTLHEPEILTWPEVQTAGLAGAEIADRMTLLHELQEAYNKAFAAAASASSAPRATAGAL